VRDHLGMGGAARAGQGDTTFLLTDIVDSTRLWEDDAVAMASATARLDAAVAEIVPRHGGSQVKPRGEGDAHFLVFGHPGDAADAAASLVVAVAAEPLLAVRAALHVGPAELRDGDWYGTTVNRCARLRAVAHPRQVLVSAAAAEALPPERVRSLGRHRLKDVDVITEVFQLLGDDLVQTFPPLPTLERRHDLPLPLTSFVGRDALLAEVVEAMTTGCPVTIVGPPGVGKRRLSLEAQRVAFELDVAAPAPTVSYAPTGVAGERVVPVFPLGPLDTARLFLDRIDEAPGGNVSDVVDHLDGLPLAIELAARRARAMPLDRLARRLADDPLAVLGSDRNAHPAYHRSFRDALDHCAAVMGTDIDRLRSEAPPPWAASWFDDRGPLPLLQSLIG